MIKVGIYGSAALNDPVRKQLLRLLLRHPDVDLRAVASPGGNTVAISELHPVFAGETELTLERVLNLNNLEVLFVIDEENLTEEIMTKFAEDSDFRLIVLGKAPKLQADPGEDFVYGLPEYTRKPLVRGARAAVAPRPIAMLTELALLPLAKSGLLPASVDLTIAASEDPTEAVREAQTFLGYVQAGYNGPLTWKSVAQAPYHRLDLEAVIETPIAIEEVERIYNEAYSDHNFVYTIPGEGIDEDLRGSNKCLLQINANPKGVTVHASMDALTKGCTGNAVHIMDLLFGLHERTGLSI